MPKWTRTYSDYRLDDYLDFVSLVGRNITIMAANTNSIIYGANFAAHMGYRAK
ncbi:hypothetical protein V4D07_06690 [Paenibacillus taichungensis]